MTYPPVTSCDLPPPPETRINTGFLCSLFLFCFFARFRHRCPVWNPARMSRLRAPFAPAYASAPASARGHPAPAPCPRGSAPAPEWFSNGEGDLSENSSRLCGFRTRVTYPPVISCVRCFAFKAKKSRFFARRVSAGLPSVSGVGKRPQTVGNSSELSRGCCRVLPVRAGVHAGNRLSVVRSAGF